MQHAVYLDHNATSPVRPEAAAAVAAALTSPGNASSVHRFGRLARRTIEDARDAVAALVGVRPDQIALTSGGTEANNWALTGMRAHDRGQRPCRLLVSAIEHASVLEAAPDAERIAVDEHGRVDTGDLQRRLDADPRPALIAVMLANNETGVIQPLRHVVAIARAYGALVHCDAVQAAGKIALDVSGLGVDTLALSAHKLGGPMGSGALVVGPYVTVDPILRGGGHESRRRAGTENLPGVAGFGAAASVSGAKLPEQSERLTALRDQLEAALRAEAPELLIFGSEAERLPNTSCLALPGLTAEILIMALDLAGVAVGAGAACSSGKIQSSHVLAAMGVGDDAAKAAIRVSLGWSTTSIDVDRFVDAWITVARRHRSRVRQRAS